MKYIYVVILLIIPCISVAQKKRFGPPTKAEERLAEKWYQCYYSKKFTPQQRVAFFPFNAAGSIEIISFEEADPNAEILFDGVPSQASLVNPLDTMRIFTPIAVNKFKLNDHRVRERVILTKVGIDSLTDILYNVGFTPIKTRLKIADPGARCYIPRNAILFYNENKSLTQYIEFCFSCSRYYLSSSQIKNTEYCEQKFDMLKAFFLHRGIKYGTVLPKKSE